ncbi:unnamed protein product [Porites lobata]|uniref:MADF domain-containing protein n=1 Tax=Porites lobata TaxID=104759 RepID=A0ABN8NZF7_9CNID|nr:unnamed protein product [Porites lobata]
MLKVGIDGCQNQVNVHPAHNLKMSTNLPAKKQEGDKPAEKMMFWTDRHDVILCREILIHNPFHYKKSSIQRGQVWNDIAERLVAVDEERFKSDLDRRGVRDRYNLLANKLRRKLKDERKASGIETDMSEVEVALEDLIEREDESNKQHKENQDQNLKRKEDRQQAEDIRTKSLERLGETQKRKGQDSNLQTKAKKKRATGGDAVVFLRERTEAMVAARKEEVNMKVKQQEAESKRHQDFLELMRQQQQQQQQQMHNMQAMLLQQQQQQTQLIMALVSKLDHK